jgi:hypothetical protein
MAKDADRASLSGQRGSERPVMGDEGSDFEAAVRRAFARLIHEDLPDAAARRGWPLRAPDEFERLLLDHLSESPAPEGEPTLFDLVLAVELGQRMLAGNLCCATMSRRQFAAVKDPRRADAWKALIGVLAEAGRARDR